MYSNSACLLSHYSKYIDGKQEGKNNNISRGREATGLGSERRFSQGWCGAEMNTIASLSLIRPLLVSLWAGPPSRRPRRGLSTDLGAPFSFLFLSPTPFTLLHLTAIIPIRQPLWWQGSPSVGMLKKGTGSEAGGGGKQEKKRWKIWEKKREHNHWKGRKQFKDRREGNKDIKNINKIEEAVQGDIRVLLSL